MNRVVGAHPVALLQPGLQVMAGAALLGWVQAGPVGLALGWVLIGLGASFAVAVARPVWHGPIRLEGDRIRIFAGPFSFREMSIRRDEILEILPRPGAGLLRYDPVQLALSLATDLGSIELALRGGERHRVGPVSMAAVEMVATWHADEGPMPVGKGGPVQVNRATTLTLLLTTAFVFGVAGISAGAGSATLYSLIACAFLCEMAFWGGLFTSRSSGSQSP